MGIVARDVRPSSVTQEGLVYRLEVPGRSSAEVEVAGMTPLFMASVAVAARQFSALRAQFGVAGAIKAVLKVLTDRRCLCGFLSGGRLASYVWSAPRSAKYPVEPGACVLGPLLTRSEFRRRGLAAATLENAVSFLSGRGYRIFYIDTTTDNIASQRTIARAGFGPPYGVIRDGTYSLTR
jgi:GNAT superfamily N-acetyltransferase